MSSQDSVKTLASAFHHDQYPHATILEKLKSHCADAINDVFTRMESAQHQRHQDEEKLFSNTRISKARDAFLAGFTLSFLQPNPAAKKPSDIDILNKTMKAHCVVGDAMRDAIIDYMNDHQLTANTLSLTDDEQRSLRKLEQIKFQDNQYILHFSLPNLEKA